MGINQKLQKSEQKLLDAEHVDVVDARDAVNEDTRDTRRARLGHDELRPTQRRATDAPDRRRTRV